MQEESPVRLMKHFIRPRLAQRMAHQFVRAVSVIQFGKKQRLAVIGPRHAAITVVKRQFGDHAGAQLFDE